MRGIQPRDSCKSSMPLSKPFFFTLLSVLYKRICDTVLEKGVDKMYESWLVVVFLESTQCAQQNKSKNGQKREQDHLTNAEC